MKQVTTTFLLLAFLAYAIPSLSQAQEANPAPSGEAEPQLIKRTWMGIRTSHVSKSLRKHLNIEEGFGIEIHEVIPQSPADKGGLQPNDILLQFEDQLLISPEHLSLLVRREKPGTSIELTAIRSGKSKKLAVSLEETDSHPYQASEGPPPGYGDPRRWRDSMWREWMKEHPRQQNPVDPPRQEGKPPSVSVKPGTPIHVQGTAGVVKIDNPFGEVTISQTDGEHTIEILDENSESVYVGDYDPEEGIEGLPQEAREQLKRMKLEDLKILAPKIRD